MTVELKKGYYIDSYYDKNTRSYITILKDEDGNQVRDAYYSGNMTDRNADIQYMKEFFNQYMNEALNLRKTIKDTKEKTKKAKLPALSILSPIMPDAAAGISTFNSGVGLSEDYIGRQELIKRLKAMGYKYNYPKYTDQELYEIYKKSLKAEETKQAFKKLKAAEKARKQRYKDKLSQVKYDEDSDTYSDGGYYKDGIEFESEDAAREYFGESMDNKFYLNDMHKAWDMTDLEDEISIPNNRFSLNESMNNNEKKMKAFLQRLMRINYKDFDFSSHLIDDYDIIIKPDVNNSLDLDNKEIVLNRELSPEDAVFTIIKLFRDKNVIDQSGKFTESHDFKTITEGLKYFERKEFNENCRDAELESLYEGIKNNLDQEDIKKLGNFLKKADSADDVATYIRGLLSEDLDNSKIDYYELATDILNYASNEWNVWNTDIYNIFKDRNKVDFYVKGDWKHDHWAFDDALKEYLATNYPKMKYDLFEYELDEGEDYDSDFYPAVHSLTILKDEDPLVFKLLEPDDKTLTEARKPKYVDSQFGRHVKDAMDKGELTYDNIKEWDRKYNGGIDPVPAFNTRELMNFYYMRPDYFDESLKEDIYSTALGDIDKEKIPQTRRRNTRTEDEFFKLAGDLAHEIQQVGFELDNDVKYPIGPNLMGGVHLQIKNPNLLFPIEEAKGDEKLAFELMIDDLKDIQNIFDKFEEDNDVAMTYSFGPNENMVITGGVDIR